jgi:hypothetical protein
MVYVALRQTQWHFTAAEDVHFHIIDARPWISRLIDRYFDSSLVGVTETKNPAWLCKWWQVPQVTPAAEVKVENREICILDTR